jgi:hypothetical protein
LPTSENLHKTGLMQGNKKVHQTAADQEVTQLIALLVHVVHLE